MKGRSGMNPSLDFAAIGSAARSIPAIRTEPAKELSLLREPTDDEAQVRRVGGELPEGRIDRDPISQKDFRPGVVVKLPADIGQAGGSARWNAHCARECHVQL